MAYVVGDTVKLTATFKVDGIATNPTAVTLKVRSPGGAVTTYSSGFGQPSTGVYTKQVAVDVAGTWHYRWEGTGIAPGVEEGTFRVEESGVV